MKKTVDIFVKVQRCLYAISDAKQLLVILELLQIGVRRTCRYFMDSMFLDTRWNIRRTKKPTGSPPFSQSCYLYEAYLGDDQTGCRGGIIFLAGCPLPFPRSANATRGARALVKFLIKIRETKPG